MQNSSLRSLRLCVRPLLTKDIFHAKALEAQSKERKVGGLETSSKSSIFNYPWTSDIVQAAACISTAYCLKKTRPACAITPGGNHRRIAQLWDRPLAALVGCYARALRCEPCGVGCSRPPPCLVSRAGFATKGEKIDEEISCAHDDSLTGGRLRAASTAAADGRA